MKGELYTTPDGYKYIQRSDFVVKQLNPVPIKYDSNYIETYDTKEYKQNSLILNNIRLATIIQAIGKKPSRLLDFGYGNGDFLKVASKHVNECHGYDITFVPIPYATKVESPIDCAYDVVCFFDSLEHVNDIDATITSLDTKYVIISLPCAHFGFTWGKWDFDNWKHRKPNEHLWHFTPQALNCFMIHQGYIKVLQTSTEDLVRLPERNEQNILTGVYKKQDKSNDLSGLL